MFDWLTHRGSTAKIKSLRVAPRIVRDDYPTAGEYELLHRYLRDRYANRVVLTFAEIEDLLGFSLPDLARGHLAWWDGGDFDSAPSAQSFAWTLAGRTATVNLPARSCVRARAGSVESAGSSMHSLTLANHETASDTVVARI